MSPAATALQGNSSITSGTAAPNTSTTMARDDDGIPIAKTKQCHECRAHPALYQCPRCSFRSCSLPCCRAHKRRTQCNGRRDKTQFLKVSQMNDATLTSDYLFLEEIVGRVDAGKRLLRSAGGAGGGGRNNNSHSNKSHHHKRPRREGGGGEADTAAAAAAAVEDEAPPPHTLLQAASSSSIIGEDTTTTKGIARILPQQNHHPTPQQLPPKWRNFQRLAASRWTTVLFMPTGMARHQQNKSFVKKDTLHWTIEWRWHGGDDDDHADANGNPEKQQSPPQIQTTTVSETSVVGDVLRSLRWAGPQDDTTSSSNVSMLRKRLPGRSDQPKYVEIAPTATVREALQHATVYEFPTLDLVPHSNNRRLLADFPRLIADVVVATTSTVVNEGQDEPKKNSDS